VVIIIFFFFCFFFFFYFFFVFIFFFWGGGGGVMGLDRVLRVLKISQRYVYSKAYYKDMVIETCLLGRLLCFVFSLLSFQAVMTLL